MIEAAIYNKVNGKIRAFYSGPLDHIDLNTPEGYAYLEDCPQDATHIIEGVPCCRAVPNPYPNILT